MSGTVTEKFWLGLIAQLQCVVCARGYFVTAGRAHVHHVAPGSAPRSDFSVAPLCEEHHTGASGFHKLGEERFCKLFRVPFECELGLLVWMAEDLARFLRSRAPSLGRH